MNEPAAERPGGAYVVAQMLILTALAVEARHPRRGLRRVLGPLAVASGGAVIVVAGSRLGRRLRADPAPPEDAVLRTDGPYRLVRHPIYTGLLLLGLGLATLGSARAFVLWAGLLAVLINKTSLEERLLLERFPEYADYQAGTPRFVPLVTRIRAW